MLMTQTPDLLTQARQAALAEMESLREKPVRKKKRTILTGFKPASFDIVVPQTTLSIQG